MEYKGYTIEIERDEFNDSPRDWDNLGTMVTWHRRYPLGDEQPKSDVDNWLSNMVDIHVEPPRGKDGYVTKQWDDFIDDLEAGYKNAIDKAWKLLQSHIVILDLYLYDHSGLTMSTSPFSCPWDSGQVGFIYATKEDIRKEYNVRRISAKTLKKAISVLESEVKMYSQFLQGDVWGYLVEKGDEFVDGCWGFYGHDYCLSEAKNIVDHLVEGK